MKHDYYYNDNTKYEVLYCNCNGTLCGILFTFVYIWTYMFTYTNIYTTLNLCAFDKNNFVSPFLFCTVL